MSSQPIFLTSPVTLSDLLCTAVRVKNMPLTNQCTEKLDSILDKTNAVIIFSAVSNCLALIEDGYNDHEPSAPPLVDNPEQCDFYWLQDILNKLELNCLLEIDANADFVLKQPEILNLSYSALKTIVERDSLQVSNELLVYSAVYRWAKAECERDVKEVSPENIRTALKQLYRYPRYGLLSKKEFTTKLVDGEKGPTRSGVLEEQVWRKILFYIKEKSKRRPVESLPYNWSKPRIMGNEKPRVLSERSATRAMAHDAGEQEKSCDNKTKFDKFVINVLTCWTAVFD